jgi:hypothetical protein
MLRSVFLAALAGVATAILDSSFNGTGQIRALAHGTTNGTDLGCLTNAGQWTTTEDDCGVFTGDRNGATGVYITSEYGSCGRAEDSDSVLYFNCAEDQDALDFWVRDSVVLGGTELETVY